MVVPVSVDGDRGARGAGATYHDGRVRSPMLVLMGEIVGIGGRVQMVVVDLDQLARRPLSCLEPMDTTPYGGEHQHPATPHPKRASMAGEGIEDVATQEDES
jgi:hypothetical protein